MPLKPRQAGYFIGLQNSALKHHIQYIEQLRLYLLNKPIYIFTINETITNAQVNIQGLYNLWTKDRCRYGGGVAIYTRDVLNVRDMSSFIPETSKHFV